MGNSCEQCRKRNDYIDKLRGRLSMATYHSARDFSQSEYYRGLYKKLKIDMRRMKRRTEELKERLARANIASVCLLVVLSGTWWLLRGQ